LEHTGAVNGRVHETAGRSVLWVRPMLELRVLWQVLRVARLLRSDRTLPEVAAVALGPVRRSRAAFRDHRRVARAVRRLVSTHRMPIRRQCLYRSLVLGRLLRQRGLDARLNVCLTGLDQERAAGHAWLTVDGKPVDKRRAVDEDRYRGRVLGHSDLICYWLPVAASAPSEGAALD